MVMCVLDYIINAMTEMHFKLCIILISTLNHLNPYYKLNFLVQVYTFI